MQFFLNLILRDEILATRDVTVVIYEAHTLLKLGVFWCILNVTHMITLNHDIFSKLLSMLACRCPCCVRCSCFIGCDFGGKHLDFNNIANLRLCSFNQIWSNTLKDLEKSYGPLEDLEKRFQ